MMSARLTETQVDELYNRLYGTDAALKVSDLDDGIWDFDIENGDFKIIGKKRSDLPSDAKRDIERLIKQFIVAYLMTSIDMDTGISETGLEDGVGSALSSFIGRLNLGSDEQVILISELLKIQIVNAMFSCGYVATVNSISALRNGRDLAFVISVSSPTGETFDITVTEVV